MRRNEQSSVRASDLASIVLPVPGTSSISTCPSHSSATSSKSMTSRLPTITRSILSPARSANPRIGSTSSTSGAQVGEAVADAPLGEDVARIGGVVLQLLPQVVDVQPHVVRRIAILGTPDAAQEGFVRHHHTWVRGQVV